VAQGWWPIWTARLEAGVSLWRTQGGWDYGAGVLLRMGERTVEPWVMVARPW